MTKDQPQPGPASDWIGVAAVAAEMGLTRGKAWGYIKRIGVPVSDHRRVDDARFLRSEFEAARKRSMAAPPPRKGSKAPPPAPAAPIEDPRLRASARLEKLRKS